MQTNLMRIPTEIRTAMIEHARSGLPHETCGFLAGEDDQVLEFYPIRNEDESAKTYFMDARERLRAEQEIEDKAWRVLAVYHSHTLTPAEPSPTDRERA